MKKMMNHTARYNDHNQEIKQLLMDIASFDTSGDTPESALMIQAAEYIRLLETLLDIYVKFAGDSEYGHEWIDEWKEFASKQKELSPEFVKIVEENFWELLA